LDNVPIGYPNFDSTPSPISTSQGPFPSAPIVNFTTATGATSGVSISAGGTVYFVDASVQSPSAYRPLGWTWNFGATASPTGSTDRKQIVTYGATGVYSVTLTAYNAGGTGSKTKSTFVTVT
jgi:PKD repeat protein